MTRKKVKLAFIVNDSARKATFKKRKKGLLKKVDELSTLCGIDACAIIYSPYDPQPEVWPSPLGVQQVLSKFRRMPEMEQSKKMVNQESFLRQRIAKATEQLKKQTKENREKEITQLMFQYLGEGNIMHNVSMLDLNDLAYLIDQNLKDINRRIELLSREPQPQSQTPMPPPPPLVKDEVVANVEVEGQGSHAQQGLNMNMNMDSMQPKENWFLNLMNGANVDQPHAFGDANQQSGFWPNTFFH